jgi:15-cis-phytoene synthase
MFQTSSEALFHQPPIPFDASDQAYCRALLKGGSRSFFAASFLLPSHVRDPAVALYAFCRVADDVVDEGDATDETINALHRRVDDIYNGTPQDHPIDRAFAGVAQRYRLPRAAINALIEGFTWDMSGRRYKTFADIQDYAARVAGCVGIMMTTIMQARDPAVLARAADLGVAMQLTNIARDVGEDARNGRLYLPTDWLIEAGIDPDQFMMDPQFTPQLGQVIAKLLAEADHLYRRADAGIAMLPADCRAGIRSARTIYAAIGDAVATNGFDSITSRAFVPTPKKLRLMAKVLLPNRHDRSLEKLPPLLATSFLVEAVGLTAQPVLSAPIPSWWQLSERVMPVLTIFEKLKRMEQANIGKSNKGKTRLPSSSLQTG